MSSESTQRDLAEKFMRAGENQEVRRRRAFEELLRSMMPSGMTAPTAASGDKVVVACGGCGQKNRVAVSRIREARCGACKAPLAG